MERGMNKVVLVTRKTRLKELIYKYNTVEQAQFYMEHMGADFSDYLREDRNYREAVAKVAGAAEKYARVQQIDREFLPHMIFGEKDIVIVIGQDGLVANTMKYLNRQPLIGINPDPARWDGILLPFEVGQAEAVLCRTIAGNHAARQVTMAQAKTRDGQTMLAVNDLFIGQRTHVSARYDITWNRRTEHQSSSGIIISTGLGSTGWYRSVIAQAAGICREVAGQSFKTERHDWDENKLFFAVREPFPSRSTQTDIVFGKIGETDHFRILSQMPGNGVIFSDGIEADAIEFNSGTEVTIKIAPQKGILVV